MTFGDLTHKEKLVLEQRTALFVNLAGVTAQKELSSFEQGISTRKLYKILANVIYDWHWLSFNHSEAFVFNGIGNLVWVPHRFGALGQIKPAIEYEDEDIRLHHGYFANLADLFKSKLYNSYGYRDTTGSPGKMYFLFPAYISYDQLSKSWIEPQEQFFWEELVRIYSTLSDTSLDALASCRSKTAGAHSLWIQFVMWKRDMGTAIDTLRKQFPASLDSSTKKFLLNNIESARACIRHIFQKISHHNNIQKHIEEVQKRAFYTELSSFIPCIDELDSPIISTYPTFVELTNSLEALHDICREFQIQLGLDKHKNNISLNLLEDKLHYLGESLNLSPELVDSKKWCTLFLQKDKRIETARQILTLIESSFSVFEQKLELKFERPSGHYGNFLSRYYLLPKEQFIQGY